MAHRMRSRSGLPADVTGVQIAFELRLEALIIIQL